MRISRRAFLGTALAAGLSKSLLAADTSSVRVPQPEWVNYPPLRAKGNFRSAARVDTECHLRSGHGYAFGSEEITSVHEETHGINSNIRMGYAGGTGVWNAFYVFGDKACVVTEPGFSHADVTKFVPNQLRGQMYQDYMLKAANGGDWAREPLYMYDEWTAYVNGLRAAIEIGDWNTSDLRFSLEFGFLALAVLGGIHMFVKDYPYLAQIENFTLYNWHRMMRYWDVAAERRMNFILDPLGYYRRFQQGTAGSVPGTRKWIKSWCGEALASEVFRI